MRFVSVIFRDAKSVVNVPSSGTWWFRLAAAELGFSAWVLAIAFLAYGSAAANDKLKVDVVPQVGHSNVGHTWGVHSAAFSPDSRTLLSSGEDGMVKLWDAATGRLLRNFEGDSRPAYSIAFSSNGQTALATSGFSIKAWNVETGQLLRSFDRTFDGKTGLFREVALSPDGRSLLSSSDGGTLTLSDFATGQLIRTFEGPSIEVTSLAFSPDGRQAIAGYASNILKLWDVASGRQLQTFKGHSGPVYPVAFSPDGRNVLSGSYDGLKLWSLATGETVRSVEPKSQATAIAFSPDGNSILAAAFDSLQLFEATTGRLIHDFNRYLGPKAPVAFSPDGRLAVSGIGENDNGLILWDVATWKERHTLEGKSKSVTSVAISAGHGLLSGSEDSTAKLWDPFTGHLLRTLQHSEPVQTVASSPNGHSVLTGSYTTLKLWDVESGQLLRTFEGSYIGVAALSSDGNKVLSTNGRTLSLWDVVIGKLLHVFNEGNCPCSVAFSPNGRNAISGDSDSRARLWDIETGQLMRVFEGHSRYVYAVAFSPSGELALTGSEDATVKLWNVATGELLRNFEGHSSGVTSVAFSPNGRHVVSASEDATVKLWDLATGQIIQTFKGHSGAVSSVAYASNGRAVFSGGSDGTTRVWDVHSGQELVQMLGKPDSEWLTMTPDGFFAASDGGLDLVSVVQGLKSYSVNQFRDQLFREDLVRERLSGDVLGKYRDAVSKRNTLEANLKSGAVPTIEFVSQSEWADDTIQLTVKIYNNEGGGIGKELEWRVINKDGKSTLQGTTTPPELQNLADPDGPIEVTHGLKLDPDQDNLITVTAKNGQGRLATEPYKIEVIKKRLGVVTPEDSVKPQPRMFIVAIGVDGYTEPQLAVLDYPLGDVTALAEAIKSVAEASGYKEAKIIKRLEQDAIRGKIKSAFDEIIAFPYQRVDTLVILLAGHGKSVDGKYYYLPFDTQFGNDRDIFTDGISSDNWKEWIAGIKVDKKLLVVDTCESSDAIAIGRGTRDDAAHITALDRLRSSLGESVVTAARQVAYEGSFLGHGVLTYSVLEALGTPRPDGSMIDLNALKAYLEEAVPRWSQKLSGLPQDPFIKINGNFQVGFPLAKVRPAPVNAETPFPGEYFLGRDVAVRTAADPGASVIETLKANTKVQVLKFDGDWTKIARQGVPRGWVPRDAVNKLLP